MFDILILLAINSFVCLGFWHSCDFTAAEQFDELSPRERRIAHRKTQSGITVSHDWINPPRKMIFWWLRYYGGQYLPKIITKPLYECVTCMASVHSIIPFTIYGIWADFGVVWWIIWPIYVLALAGINSYITTH